MSTRLTPHILSLIDWTKPIDDPLRRQFIPLKSSLVENHPKLTLDSLDGVGDSPVAGLVHRYPDKVQFLSNFDLFARHPLNSPSDGDYLSFLDLPGIMSLLHKIVLGRG